MCTLISKSPQLMEIPSFSLRLQWWFFLVNLIICISLLKLESLSRTPSFGNETDKLALLTIKHYLVDVPNGVLSSWNDSLHFCQWQRVTCSGGRQRVTTLRLEGQSLAGSFTSYWELNIPKRVGVVQQSLALSQSEHKFPPR